MTPTLSMTRNPATVVSDTLAGAANNWSQPGNAKTQDGAYATVYLASMGFYSDDLLASDYRFTIPESATITGVSGHVNAGETLGGTIRFNRMHLFNSANAIGDNLATTDHVIQGTSQYSYWDFGGAYAVWGAEELLTPDIVNSASFGFGASFINTGGSISTASVDHMPLTVYYTHPIEKAIQDFITGRPLIKTVLGDRIYQSTAPAEAQEPFLVWQILSEEPHRHQGGGSGLSQTRIQIDVYGREGSSTVRAASAVRMSLDNFTGTSSGVAFRSMYLETVNPDLTGPTDGTHTQRLRHSMDYILWHESYVPDP